jgi:hypothetical protein
MKKGYNRINLHRDINRGHPDPKPAPTIADLINMEKT